MFFSFRSPIHLRTYPLHRYPTCISSARIWHCFFVPLFFFNVVYHIIFIFVDFVLLIGHPQSFKRAFQTTVLVDFVEVFHVHEKFHPYHFSHHIHCIFTESRILFDTLQCFEIVPPFLIFFGPRFFLFFPAALRSLFSCLISSFALMISSYFRFKSCPPSPCVLCIWLPDT